MTDLESQVEPWREDRGLVTDRGLVREWTKAENYFGKSVLEINGVPLEELQGKKVLHIGVGGGRALRQALDHNMNHYGVDILPVIDTSQMNYSESTDISKEERQRRFIRKDNIESMRKQLFEVAQKYPNRIFASDASHVLPFAENSMDYVLATISLPNYARNSKEAVNSILEMVRVGKEKAIFTKGWEESTNPAGIVELGMEGKTFKFGLKGFLDSLNDYGIKWKITNGLEGADEFKNVTLDLSNKDSGKLVENREKILQNSNEYSIT